MAKELKELVFEAMDNAVDNGFFADMTGDTPENVAIDLLDYDADIGGMKPDVAVMDLIPHIEAWRADRKVRDSKLDAQAS